MSGIEGARVESDIDPSIGRPRPDSEFCLVPRLLPNNHLRNSPRMPLRYIIGETSLRRPLRVI